MTLPTLTIPISKVDDEKRFVFGWGNVPVPGSVAKDMFGEEPGESQVVVADSDESLEGRIEEIAEAYSSQFSGPETYAYVVETYDTFVIGAQYSWAAGDFEDAYFKHAYVVNGEDITFGAGVEVESAWVLKMLESSPSFSGFVKQFPSALWKSETGPRLLKSIHDRAEETRKAGGPKIDYQGDIVPSYELEGAAYTFVLESRNGSVNHTGEVVSEMIESFYATQEKYLALGIPEEVAKTLHEGWWVGFHISNDDVWAGVKDGTYKMFSIGGRAISTPLVAS